MIEVESLTKYYGPTRSLNELSFTVPEGEILGFLGPNGAGKTTTMRILTGLARPTSGSVRVSGFDVARQHMAIRRILGYLPEDAPLYTEMTVEGYLRFMAGVKLLDKKTVGSEVDRVLEEVGLAHVRSRVTGNLSKGMRQRVGLAQALLGDPRILILDEPTVGLDPTQITEIRRLIAEMKGRRTVILSTHILPEVSITCSRVVILNEGRIVAQGDMDEIGRPGDQRVIEIRLGGAPEGPVAVETVEAHLRRAAEGVEIGIEVREDGPEKVITVSCEGKEDLRARLAATLVQNGFPLLELREVRETLEQLFLRATGEASAKQSEGEG